MHATYLTVATALVLSVTPALAQPPAWRDRGYVAVNGGYRPTSASFPGSVDVVQFAEPLEVDTVYTVESSPEFDVAAGVRVWRNLAAGIDVSRFTDPGRGAVTAAVPHPFYFNRPRPVAGDVGLGYEETGIHVQAVWMVPVTSRWQIGVSGGPSFLGVAQTVVEDVTISQSYPYDSASFAGAVSRRASRWGVGFNVGGDVSYLIAPRVGVGGSVSFSRGQIELPLAGGEGRLEVDAGGLRLGVGLRLRL